MKNHKSKVENDFAVHKQKRREQQLRKLHKKERCEMFKVSSEIYKETNFQTTKVGCSTDDQVVSKFKFYYPTAVIECDNMKAAVADKDGDLVVTRRQQQTSKRVGIIEIEHSEATEIRLVGLQVWRGALLLADFIFHNREEFADMQLLELGAGVGLTSITAAIYARAVTCTDVDIGGILQLIRRNVERNRSLLRSNVQVLEYNFLQRLEDYPSELLKAIDESDIVLAADVIYDDALTDAFVRVINTILERGIVSKRPKTIYVALEKRYVFTLAELDSVAPMFEHFLRQTVHKSWNLENMPLDFPQYFEYERCQELVLLKITSRNPVEVTAANI